MRKKHEFDSPPPIHEALASKSPVIEERNEPIFIDESKPVFVASGDSLSHSPIVFPLDETDYMFREDRTKTPPLWDRNRFTLFSHYEPLKGLDSESVNTRPPSSK
jgi:hypothetical protein